MLLVACAALARAHPGHAPTLSAEFRIGDAAVRCVVTGAGGLMQDWLGPEPTRAAGTEAFADGVQLEIDGRPVAPRVVRVGEPEPGSGFDKYLFLTVVAIYPCGERPERVAIRWIRFEGADWQTRGVVPANVRAGPDTRTVELSADEPEFVWHAPREADRPALEELPPPPPPPVRIPVLSLALAGGAVAVFFGPRRRLPALARGGAALSLLALALVARDTGAWHAGADVPEPTRAEAREIFARLHRNVYRAFQARTEDGIYELLARSVDRSLLDRLYGDIYESLLLREEGGAFCRVEQVEHLDGDVGLEPDGGRFRADWEWRVYASVSHYGHTHRRRDRYRARYVVDWDGHGWKIRSIDVRERTREPVPDTVPAAAEEAPR